MKIPGHLVQIIRRLYEANSAICSVNGCHASSFLVYREVNLFNLYGKFMTSIMRLTLQNLIGGISVKAVNISNLCIAIFLMI